MQRQVTIKGYAVRVFMVVSFLLGAVQLLQAQFYISGQNCVTPGQQYSYTLYSGSSINGNVNWYVTGGTINGSSNQSGYNLTTVSIIWNNDYGPDPHYVNAYYSGQTATFVVTLSAVFQSGNISSPLSQTISYNTVPSTIYCNASTGGGCSPVYSYQWQQSSDNANWGNISGATSQNLSFSSPLTQTTYYRRRSTVNGNTGYSNTATITVSIPPLNGGSITSGNQTITYNTIPATITASVATNGNCGTSYVYQWQVSTDNTNFTDIGGATVQNLSFSSSETQTKYYRRKTTCSSETAYTGSITITVAAPLNGGSISSPNQTITYNTIPATINAAVASGGNCGGTYSYQWQVSTDNSNFTDIGGATAQNLSFSSAETQTKYYRRRTICGSETQYTGSITVTVAAPLNGGSITSANQTITYNSIPATITASVATNGNCGTSYAYQWQSSTDNITFTDISGATAQNLAFTVVQTQTKYYRRKTTCSSEIQYTASISITVASQLNGGSVTSTNQSIAYNAIPAVINATIASGGNCGTSYIYQWQSSTNNVTFTNISGATAQNLTLTAQTQTKYYRRRTICSSETKYTGTVQVYVAFNIGCLNGSQSIQPGGAVIALTISSLGGGACSGVYTYQWERSTDEMSWTVISGATAATYTPASPAATTYYRVKVSCSGESNYTNAVSIKVKAAITTITPNSSTATASQTAIVMPSYAAGTDPANMNYVRVRTFVKPGITSTATADAQTDPYDVSQVTEYFDGLGRGIQSVEKSATPAGKDMISTTWYDEFGREAQQYLPYTDNLSTGNFRLNPATQQPAFYNSYLNNTEGFYYSKTLFEASPLNRVLKTTAPGNSWTGNDKGGRIEQRTNRSSEDVKIWTIAAAIASVPQVAGVYKPGELYVTVTTDEHENKVNEYKDKEGKIILKKVQSSDLLQDGHTGWLCTYYIYDDLNQLRYVLQPRAVEWLASNSWNLAGNTMAQSELCFRYEYDARNRMIIKKLPGAGEVWMVYDARDRLVMTQDGKLRGQATKQWLVTEYDHLNRPIRIKLWNDANTRAYHEPLAYSSTNYPAAASGYELLTETYYDDYSYAGAKSYDNSYNSQLQAGNNRYAETNPSVKSSLTRGMVTGSKTKVLGTASQYLITSMFYDDKGRVIQSQADNASGGVDITTNQYDFSGKALSSVMRHQKTGAGALTVTLLTKMQYDHAGRVMNIKKVINGGTEKLVAQNSYDELGQLKTKQLGQKPNATPLESLDYKYNIRGWLTGINRGYANPAYSSEATAQANRWFGMELSYDFGYGKNQLNGNIAGIKWKSNGDDEQRAYGFDYDNVNRLLKADFTQNNSGWNTSAGVDFSIKMGDGSSASSAYDANGNIIRMQQWGLKITGSSQVDDMLYSYYANTNKLRAVTEQGSGATDHKLGDFTDKNTTTTDYGYDVNGNMVTDLNKKLNGTAAQTVTSGGAIVYNYLNLPQTINAKKDDNTVKGTITYTYDAAGNKLKKVTVDNTVVPAKTTTTEYINGFIYENDKLQFTGQEEGRIRAQYDAAGTTLTGFVFDYFIKDHLGNVRMVLTEETAPAAIYQATMESANRTNETQLFTQIPETESTKPAGFDSDGNNQTVSKLFNSGTTDKRVGPGVVLKVMAGDKFKALTKGWYLPNSTDPAPPSGATSIVNSLISAFSGGMPVGASHTGTQVSGSGVLSLPVGDFVTYQGTQSVGTRPKAYLNWMILDDEQFKLVAGNYGTVQIPEITGTMGKQVMQANNGTDIEVKKNGYLYVYVSNESQGSVYFDDIRVEHTRGSLIEETHYYPFGLTMSGISSKALKSDYAENKHKFNDGTELNTDFDIGLYETLFRTYDPQIGRFTQIDPLAEDFENWSPFVFAYNNPVYWNDPLGLEGNSFNDWNEVFQEIFKQIENGNLQQGTYYNVAEGGVAFQGGNFSWSKSNRTLTFQPNPIWLTNTEVHEDGSETVAHLMVFNAKKRYIADEYMPYEESGWDYVPMVGSSMKAYDHFKKGRWGWGIFHSVLAIGDVFAVKAAVTAVGKYAVTTASKSVLKKAVLNPSLTEREAYRLAVTKSPGVAAMMRGKGIERAFRQTAGNNVILNIAMRLRIMRINPSNKGADIIGKGLLKGTWWDITTAGDWGKHVTKYGEGGIGLIY